MFFLSVSSCPLNSLFLSPSNFPYFTISRCLLFYPSPFPPLFLPSLSITRIYFYLFYLCSTFSFLHFSSFLLIILSHPHSLCRLAVSLSPYPPLYISPPLALSPSLFPLSFSLSHTPYLRFNQSMTTRTDHLAQCLYIYP